MLTRGGGIYDFFSSPPSGSRMIQRQEEEETITTAAATATTTACNFSIRSRKSVTQVCRCNYRICVVDFTLVSREERDSFGESTREDEELLRLPPSQWQHVCTAVVKSAYGCPQDSVSQKELWHHLFWLTQRVLAGAAIIMITTVVVQTITQHLWKSFYPQSVNFIPTISSRSRFIFSLSTSNLGSK